MQQISQSTKQQSAESADDMVVKVKSLERDLYYYRKTSRDLRKKLQTLTSSERVGMDGDAGLIVEGVKMAAEERVNSAPELEESGRSHGKARKKRRGVGGLVARKEMVLDERMGGIEAAASIFATRGAGAKLGKGKVGGTVSSQQVVGRAATSQHQVGGDATSQHQVGGAVSMVVKKHKNELRQLR